MKYIKHHIIDGSDFGLLVTTAIFSSLVLLLLVVVLLNHQFTVEPTFTQPMHWKLIMAYLGQHMHRFIKRTPKIRSLLPWMMPNCIGRHCDELDRSWMRKDKGCHVSIFRVSRMHHGTSLGRRKDMPHIIGKVRTHEVEFTKGHDDILFVTSPDCSSIMSFIVGRWWQILI